MAKPVQKHQNGLARRSTWARFKGLFARRAPQRSLNVDRSTVGRSGALRSQSWGGWRPADEWNTHDYPDARAFFREMQKTRTDGKVRGAIEYIASHQMPGDAAYFRPRGSSPAAIRNANYANELFGLGGGEAIKFGLTDFSGRTRFEGDFATRWRQISNWQFDGVAIAEEVYVVAPDADGVDRIWLRDLKPRWGGHIKKWHSNEDGEICAVTMRPPMWDTGRGEYRLPIANDPEHTGGFKNSLHIAFKADGSEDPEGRTGALLRACSGSRRLKDLCFNQLGAGLTTWGTPRLRAKLLLALADQLSLAPDTLADAKALIESAMESLHDDPDAFITTSDVIDVDAIDSNFNPDQIVNVLNHLNHEMLTALFMHWLAMGVAQSHGSGAAAITHGNAVLQVSRALAARTSRELERQTIARLIHANFASDEGGTGPIPQLVFPGIEPNPFAGKNIAGDVAAGILTPTDDIELVLRQQIPGASLDFESRPWRERLASSGATPPKPNDGRPADPQAPTASAIRSAMAAGIAMLDGPITVADVQSAMDAALAATDLKAAA